MWLEDAMHKIKKTKIKNKMQTNWQNNGDYHKFGRFT